MDNKEKKYPKVVIGAYIFRHDKKLLLVRAPAWNNKFTCVGGKIEMGEKAEDTVKREVKEETNLDLEKLKLIGITDGLELGENSRGYKHLIFIDYKVDVKNTSSMKLNKEGENYEWHVLDEWLAKDEDEFAPSNYEIIKKLKEDEEKEDYEYKYRRALADYQNLLKQTAKEKAEFGQFARENFLHEILPVYDNLKLSLQHTDREAEKNGWLEGIKHIAKQFKSVLEDMGVEEINTTGKKFDHNTMEALEGKGEYVVKEIVPGYKLNGKIIRAAKVVVGDDKK